MKKLRKLFYCNVALLLLVLLLAACSGNKKEESKNPSDNDSALHSEENNDETKDSNQIGKEESEPNSKESATKDSEENSSKESATKDSEENSSKESATKDSEENSSKGSATDDHSKETSSIEERNEGKGENDNVLGEYSSDKIEYARVWLQLGPNQDIDELNVRHISAGEPINPNDDSSASYPEDVIQLAGSRLVDGSVTYSGNGNGTINVYNVPLRWDSADNLDKGIMKKETEDIKKNTKKVYVDTGDDKKIKRLIDIMVIH
ncbi:MSCRAMM family adhesin SdrC [Bacillus subtilis]|uniref:MSCRAMM family adhesin SdrC n=1 Tax=Bacillus subtilis TaxID=1423 RepID=UPI001E4305D2|nr:MSCRAMM family adhesin SdrC [Bacillus subtilis]